MPLTFLGQDKVGIISHINGKDETRKFLENLGFLRGEKVTVVATNGDDLIVNIRGTRIAIGKTMAMRIYVNEL